MKFKSKANRLKTVEVFDEKRGKHYSVHFLSQLRQNGKFYCYASVGYNGISRTYYVGKELPSDVECDKIARDMCASEDEWRKRHKHKTTWHKTGYKTRKELLARVEELEGRLAALQQPPDWTASNIL